MVGCRVLGEIVGLLTVGDNVGNVVGSWVGSNVGVCVGEYVGEAVGNAVGVRVGERDGALLGVEEVGDFVGCVVGNLVGLRVGWCDGVVVDGDLVGCEVGLRVGLSVGRRVGDLVGRNVASHRAPTVPLIRSITFQVSIENEFLFTGRETIGLGSLLYTAVHFLLSLVTLYCVDLPLYAPKPEKNSTLGGLPNTLGMPTRKTLDPSLFKTCARCATTFAAYTAGLYPFFVL